jgi:hypothetical protein
MTDAVSRFLGQRKTQDNGGGGCRGGFIDRAAGLFIGLEESLDAPTELSVFPAGLVEVGDPVLGGQL